MSNRVVNRKFSTALLCVFLFSFLIAEQALAARANRTVGNAKELQKALDDGITDIKISSSLTGNFIVPRWVYSIFGTNQNITLTPADESNPVFGAESSTKKNLVRTAEVLIFWPAAAGHALMSEATSKTLEFSNMTILCDRNSGLSADYISKPVTIRNVTFEDSSNIATPKQNFSLIEFETRLNVTVP